MDRLIISHLTSWLLDPARKPLVLRGARQVGKTWLVRAFAKMQGKTLVEINFERDLHARAWFTSNDPKRILAEISLVLNRSVDSESCLLFLDEIQAAGEILGKLRWFAEEMPGLPVIAAGSLLEFTLADHDFSMPVGRVQFLHIEPMSFSEFLLAHGQTILLERLRAWNPGMELSQTLHAQAGSWFERYGMVGGMPAIVAQDAEGASPRKCREMQLDLIATFRADFAKYRKRISSEILDATLIAISRSLGRKFVYAHVADGIKQHQAKTALELLYAARVGHLVYYSAANGLPLGGESKDSFRKAILVDVGCMHALLQTPASDAYPRWEQLAPQVRGQIAEQIAGQQLRLIGPFSGDGPQLYYWQREGGRPGEIDYLVQLNGRIVPVELKSGTAGAMKSLHQFMYDKQLAFAVRFDQNPPSLIDLSVKTTQGNDVRYRLLSLPWYLGGFMEKISP